MSEGTLAVNHVADIKHDVPLIVCITRLVAQKGLHLITHAIKHTEELVSLLSSTCVSPSSHLSLSLSVYG